MYEKYAIISESQVTPKTPQQLIRIVKPISTNDIIFSESMEKWNTKPEVYQTRTNFKQLLTEAQNNNKNPNQLIL